MTTPDAVGRDANRWLNHFLSIVSSLGTPTAKEHHTYLSRTGMMKNSIGIWYIYNTHTHKKNGKTSGIANQWGLWVSPLRLDE
ncbi:hypothetical protein H5410_009914 [Solanum commersonii]|uniref:Uncharacterized protein n=1 Tax=Solanum commersonii TaxID=4109 RepID=A0A9J6AJ90_SOLCO|nr:hypothetical protein H5410_009914 [Solanum commersonii]